MCQGVRESYGEEKHLGCILERVGGLTGELEPRRRNFHSRSGIAEGKGTSEDVSVTGAQASLVGLSSWGRLCLCLLGSGEP